MKIAMLGVSGVGKSTLARFVSEQYNLPINPVGSRSIAKEMGFVGPDPVTGELVGRPYDVDLAHLWTYADATQPGTPQDKAVRAMRRWADAPEGHYGATDTVRPLFQRKLAEAKIAWETTCARCHHEELRHDGHDQTGSGYCRMFQCECDAFMYPAFVTDRTPLDDMMYAMMHCPSVVDQAFIDRAYAHTCQYDAIFYLPLGAGQWLNGDAARKALAENPMYHWHGDVILQGLIAASNVRVVGGFYALDTLQERQKHVRNCINHLAKWGSV